MLKYHWSMSRTECRSCKSRNLFKAIDLGNQPIANRLMRNSKEFIELFPLSMLICEDCALGQLSYDVKQQILFEDYRYTSSTSGTMLQHSKNYVDEILKIINFSKSDYVLEIACNDGYLLNFFALLDINSVGIDPATNIISLIKNPRITTINSFFTLKTAELILSEFGYPKLIIANNVLAHVPDINDFMSSLSLLCQDETLITIENPSLRILKERLQFDTIYHEHFSYLSACAMNTLCQQNNLELLSIKKLEIHGGSNRYYISKSHGLSLENNVSTEIALERQHGLNNPKKWNVFSEKISLILSNIKFWFNELGQSKVVGFGAAAKATTLINCAGITNTMMPVVGDNSLEKIGLYIPSQGQKIISSAELIESNPDHIIIFPWNISEEIYKSLKFRSLSKTKFWKISPTIEEIREIL